MDLVYEEDDTLWLQRFITGSKEIAMTHVRPYLYKHGSPAGTVKVQILDSSQVLIKETSTLTITDISTATYFHGFVRFELEMGLARETSYYCKLVTSGYSFAEANHLGWCRDYDLRVVDASYTPSDGLNSAFLFQMFEQANVVKGSQL